MKSKVCAASLLIVLVATLSIACKVSITETQTVTETISKTQTLGTPITQTLPDATQTKTVTETRILTVTPTNTQTLTVELTQITCEEVYQIMQSDPGRASELLCIDTRDTFAFEGAQIQGGACCEFYRQISPK